LADNSKFAQGSAGHAPGSGDHLRKSDSGRSNSDAAEIRRRSGDKERGHSSQASRGLHPQNLPQLTLPKGGGALKGIGEKFSVNPATGSASLAVPIYTPSGRAGVSPSLSLSYSSGGGNGPFGMGWSLDVPRIVRKTEKGLPRYDDAADSDTFILSGAEDLVAVQRFDGQAWTRDTRMDGDFAVTGFAPRQEGLFARIERWTHRVSGEVFWTSTTKDNVTSLYGRTSASRIANPKNPLQVFAWLLCETRDDRGDLVRYHYKPEDDANIPDVAAEQNRRAGQATAQRYLKHIEYGNQEPYFSEADIVSQFHFRIVFDYGEHDGPAPTLAETAVWPWRMDAFSDFRARFELRTRRLVRRILVFHQFDQASFGLGSAPVLTRATAFHYDENEIGGRLEEVVFAGYVGSGLPSEQPKLAFDYSEAAPDGAVSSIDAESLVNLPQGVDGKRYRFVDLYAEAAPGILVEEADAWFFKRNEGAAHFAALEPVSEKPNWAQASFGAQLEQLESDGQPYAVTYGGAAGYAAREDDGGWAPFHPFPSEPAIDWSDPALRHADLDGDGRADALLLRDEVIRWFRNGGRAGFEAEARAWTGMDEEAGPARILQNDLEGIFLADMTGDGLSDIVRIRNSEICYWPNLGYGTFGAKVVMANAPVFETPDLFDSGRLRLADIDGSGTTDILYLGRYETRYWINQAGNSWSNVRRLAVSFPDHDQLTNVELVDLLGIGTSCLVWSSSRPADQQNPLRFIDLMGGRKPYLLTGVDNNAGARTRIAYAASTAFYWEDKRAGRPWKSKLPFPVQVIKRVDAYDDISGGHLVSQYSYHHGCYDRSEREFRGFAAVEQLDAETVADLPPDHLPPILTRTWYETGAWVNDATVTRHLASEYFQGGLNLADSLIEGAATPQEVREAHRALRGQMLRQEIYSRDGSADQDKPYIVTENRCLVRRLQPAGVGDRDYAVFLAHNIETLTQHFERDIDDPRLLHELILDVDGFGNPLRVLKLSYPRQTARRPADPLLVAAAQAQGALLATLEETGLAHATLQTGWYRHSVPVWNAVFEVTGIAPASAGDILGYQEARQAIDAIAGYIPFAQQPGDSARKRLLSANVHRYRTDASADADPDGDGVWNVVALPLGQFEQHALPYRTWQLAFTDALLTDAFGSRLTDRGIDPAAEGYQAQTFGVTGIDGGALNFAGWWIPSALESYAPAGFYRSVKSQDIFGAVWTVAYDGAWLLPVSVNDPLGNQMKASHDYRHLAPREISDPNGNRQQASYDAFGRVIATAVLGKPGSTDGDTLADPTSTVAYFEHEWQLNGTPNYVHTRMRETHGDPATRWLESRLYSDGFGRELATKTKVRPGRASYVDIADHLASRYADPRWVGSGRTLYDNKGNPLRKYEPYFSTTVNHEEEDKLRLWGVSPQMRYDPVGRMIETRYPDGTLARVVFDAWRQETWDQNDTITDPASNWDKAAVGNLAGSKNERARALAEVHANTPAIAHFDTLGRPVLAEQDNKATATYKTRTVLDIQGNQREVWDANANRAVARTYDMAGRVLHAVSNDAGESFALAAADGVPRHNWTARGHYIRQDYDTLRRPNVKHVADPATGVEIVTDRIVYGDQLPGAATHNLIGQVHLAFDGAGLMRAADYDFKGNPLAGERCIFSDPVAKADWSALPADGVIDAWIAGASLFEPAYPVASAFDAHNRPVMERTPDGSETHFGYDEGGALRTVTVAQVPGAAATLPAVQDIAHDAKGRRAAIEYGNGVATFYSYDATTYRLTEILSTRAYAPDADGALAPLAAQPSPLQRLLYTYDPVGNIVEIEDQAQDKVFSEGVVEPRRKYEYDPLYRLIAATGREHQSQTLGGDQSSVPDALAQSIPASTDMQALRLYTQRYAYDPVGNIKQMRHVAVGGNWTRDYVYDYECAALGIVPAFGPLSHPGNSNRLYSTQLAGAVSPQLYRHDAAGNMLALGNVSQIDWNAHDQPERMQIGTAVAQYRYDAGGERTRKFIDKGNVKEERIYLGGYEVYRRWTGGVLDLRRDSLHVTDDHRRVLLIETEKDSSGAVPPGKTPVLRYQLDDHLRNACMEVDEAGAVISCEEFHPYGTTALHWKNTGLSQKRYRYTGMERDEETGFGYHSARYYLPWLARWLSADPGGMVDGPSCYAYAKDNPKSNNDRNGRQSAGEKTEAPKDISEETYVKSASGFMKDFKGYGPGKLTLVGPLEQTSDKNQVRTATGHVVYAVEGKTAFDGKVTVTVTPDEPKEGPSQKKIEKTAYEKTKNVVGESKTARGLAESFDISFKTKIVKDKAKELGATKKDLKVISKKAVAAFGDANKSPGVTAKELSKQTSLERQESKKVLKSIEKTTSKYSKAGNAVKRVADAATSNKIVKNVLKAIPIVDILMKANQAIETKDILEDKNAPWHQKALASLVLISEYTEYIPIPPVMIISGAVNLIGSVVLDWEYPAH
jgi:RHS repeat-associated protein